MKTASAGLNVSLSLCAVVFLGCLVIKPAHSCGADAELKPEDKELLDGLLKTFLFDPQGAQRVRVKTIQRSVWAQAQEVSRDGWLVNRDAPQGSRVYFTDGENIAAPDRTKLENIDFVESCRARFAAKPLPKSKEAEHHEIFEKMRRTAVGWLDETDLIMAAWLHRLGHDDLAATALTRSRQVEKDGGLAKLREDLAWTAFAGLVHAYMVRADEEALAHGERLLRLYAQEAEKEYPQAKVIVKDLDRRKKSGTFGHEPGKDWPNGFEGWDAKRKQAYLIESLDEVDARQWGQPGGVNLAGDRRVRELIQLGDAAVPDLIDTIEKDERLTRSVHFGRDFGRSRSVMGVREAALSAAMSILRVRVFEPHSTGDDFTAHGGNETRQVVEQLRAYWKQFGGMPLHERMMTVLKDPQSSAEAMREAASNLAEFATPRTLSTTALGGEWIKDPPDKLPPNPIVDKYRNPTVAEAMLAAMDRDLGAVVEEERGTLATYKIERAEDAYLSPLIKLGDKRIAGVLSQRSRQAANVRMRRKLAFAAHKLGDEQAFREFAADFRSGKITPPSNDKRDYRKSLHRGNIELGGMVESLTFADTKEANLALVALADPSHPLYALAAETVLDQGRHSSDREKWLGHPYCLLILRRGLEDTTLTGMTYRVEGNRFKRFGNNTSSVSDLPEIVSDPKAIRTEAAERICDVAANRLNELVFGLPDFHPLLKDADSRIKEVQAALDRFKGNYRVATEEEVRALGRFSWDPMFIPNVGKLAAPATDENVKAGKAIFQLGADSKKIDLNLPATAVLKQNENQEQPPRVLIVQAEANATGAVTYGIIARHEILTLPASDLVKVTPLDSKK